MAPPISLVQRNACVRFRSTIRCQSASGRSSVGMLIRRPPTLLIRMSIGSNSVERPSAHRLGRGRRRSRSAGSMRNRGRAGGLQFSLRRSELIFVATDEHQVGPGFAQRAGHFQAQPAATAGDQGSAAIEFERIPDGHGMNLVVPQYWVARLRSEGRDCGGPRPCCAMDMSRRFLARSTSKPEYHLLRAACATCGGRRRPLRQIVVGVDGRRRSAGPGEDLDAVQQHAQAQLRRPAIARGGVLKTR